MEERIAGTGSYSTEEVFQEVKKYGEGPVNINLKRGFNSYRKKESPEEMYDTLDKLLVQEDGELYYDIIITEDRENQLFEFDTDYAEVVIDRVVRKDG